MTNFILGEVLFIFYMIDFKGLYTLMLFNWFEINNNNNILLDNLIMISSTFLNLNI